MLTRSLCLAVALGACSNPSRLDAIESAPATKPAAPHALDTAAIDAWVAATVRERGAIGASLVVVRDGKTVLARGYGVATLGTDRAVDADTPFALGSISKQLACAVVLSLPDEGKLAMTDPVAKYEPKLPRANEITLADLGGHTSGYRDYYPLDYVDRRMLAPIQPDALVAEYAGLGTDFAPGSHYSYSNTGFVLLARIAERVGGKPYEQLLAERIAGPLKLPLSTTRPANAASGHVAFLLEPPTVAPFEAAGWLLGAGDVWASANALTAWNLAFVDGKVLSPAGRQAMATPRPVSDGRTSSYGCGLTTRVLNGETVLGHGGWVGGFHTRSSFVPRTRSSVVLLTNDEHADLMDVHEHLVRLVTQDPSRIPSIAGPPVDEAVRVLVEQLQAGTLDRATLGPDLADYFDAARVQAASTSLRALRAPTVTIVSRNERGGMEHAALRIAFPARTIDASVFRSPDGKIRQLLLTP